ncbi:polysaccharide biosynthesis protein [Paenibacillus prosopidis]|uniref:O-antigen/teichoic acid export membrane protein n=1 Tax=Paenibacillus prosopidis TaxID=630520 RepID=A0A368VJ64_9BACL|nr:polysaccharide biosynthesis protein [Paenibacillus prosopidis]RCW41413.1 O-antigen/teichoic acid export membrane protein [Paenibacillus prosopidis]
MNRKPARGRPAVPSELELGMQVSELPNEGRAGQRPRLLMNGVVVMAGAALLSKLIGVFQKIPLQNMAGDRVFGIYNAVYPFYQLAAVLATAGLPTAVSLLIAERLRKDKDTEGVRRTLYAALLLLGITGIAAFGWMWTGSDQVSRWIGDSETANAIRAVSVALLLAPVVAALRGYAQGLGRMTLSAASQVIEQMIRVAIMLFVLTMSWSAGWADASIAAGVMSGSAFGASASLIVLAVYFWRKRRRERLVRAPGALKAELKKLAAIALPVALGAVVVPAIGVVDAFTVPRLLRDGGLSEAEAMAMFGIYSRAQPLVQLVVMVAGAAAAALVPGLALARMRGAYGQLRVELSVAERAAWAIGAAASIGLVLLAEPLNVMLYADAKGTAAFALVGCTALAGSVNAVTAPVLQGLGAVRTPAVLLLIAALLKGALNAVLVPSYGVEGAAFAGVAALSAAAVLGAVAVRRAAASAGASLGAGWTAAGPWRRAEREPTREREQEQREQVSGSARERELDEREQVRGSTREQEQGRMPALGRAAAGTALALAVMAAALVVAERALRAALGGLLPPRAAAAALALTGVAVGACAFGAAALRGGAISARELRALPGGGVLAARLRRWRLIPPAEQED